MKTVFIFSNSNLDSLNRMSLGSSDLLILGERKYKDKIGTQKARLKYLEEFQKEFAALGKDFSVDAIDTIEKWGNRLFQGKQLKNSFEVGGVSLWDCGYFCMLNVFFRWAVEKVQLFSFILSKEKPEHVY